MGLTTIIYDGKVLAADTKLTKEEDRGGGYRAGRISKIFISRGVAVSSAGTYNDGILFEKWISGGGEIEDYPKLEKNFQAIAMDHDNVFIYMFNSKGIGQHLSLFPSIISSVAGEHYAAALADQGKNAHEIVAHVADYCNYTGLPVFSISQYILKSIPTEETGYWFGTFKTPPKDWRKFLKPQAQIK